MLKIIAEDKEMQANERLIQNRIKMLDNERQNNFRMQKPDFRNNNISKNTYEQTVKTTNPNKNSKNRSKSYEYTKSQKSQFNRGPFTKTSIKNLRVLSLDLRTEVDDPSNEYVKDEIERVIHFYKQVEQLKTDFNLIEK